MTLDGRLVRPWRLLPHRVERFYRGGLLLEQFRGEPEPADSDRPEDWVGSATRAWTPRGDPPTDEGLADAGIDGERHRVADLLAADPAAVAGADLVAAAGPSLGLLVKLLDAGVRLPVHCHPSRAFARSHLGSYFGKAEAWLIQETRDAGDPNGPGVWIGFRRDVGRDELLEIVETQDTERLLDAMHRRPTQAGDAWYIPPGVPHAIGAGIFMIEVEEPSDFSIVAETRDVPIDPADAHLGLGWDVTIDAFDREGRGDTWIDALARTGSRDTVEDDGFRSEPLVDTPFFRAERLTVTAAVRPPLGTDRFLVGVVTGGAGRVTAGEGALDVRRGDTFAIPAAALDGAMFEPVGRLEVVACLPGDVEAD